MMSGRKKKYGKVPDLEDGDLSGQFPMDDNDSFRAEGVVEGEIFHGNEETGRMSMDQQSNASSTGYGLFYRLYYRFRRFWISNRPNDWSGESDPRTVWAHLINILTLIFVAAIVLTLPKLLNIIAPRAPVAPGSAGDAGVQVFLESGTKAAVAAEATECSNMGLKLITNEKGNAADAALASILCQGVLNPYSSGLGAGGMILYYDVESRNSTVYDGLATTPSNVEASQIKASEPGSTVGVPGLLKALEKFHKENGKLEWKDILNEIADLAESWTVSEEFGQVLLDNEEYILGVPELAAVFTKEIEGLLDSFAPDDDVNTVLRQGDVLKQPELAALYRQIASQGADALYDGLASDVEKVIADNGGHLSEDEIRSYESQIGKTFGVYFDGYKLIMPAPPSAGAIVAKALTILEGFRLRRKARDASSYHVIIEAMRMALEDWDALEDAYYNDSAGNLIENMLDKDKAQELRAGIDLSKFTLASSVDRAHTADHISKNDTGTVVTATDVYGNSVSITASLGTLFGASFFFNNSSFLLNDEVLQASLRSEKLKPGARQLSGMIPAIIEDFNRMHYNVGSAGGFRAIQSIVQVLLNAAELGYDIASAIAAPRLFVDTATDEISMESMDSEDCAPVHEFQRSSGLPFAYWEQVCTGLKDGGHTILGMNALAKVQGVSILQRETEKGTVESIYYGFSDPRSQGSRAAAA